MKKLLIIFLSSITLISCDPDIPGEGINLPEMEFGFKISPDSAYIKLGDTITLSASISNTLSNGIKINDGKALINSAFGYREEIPIETIGSSSSVKIDNHINLLVLEGDVNLTSTNSILDLVAIPKDDSIKIMVKIVPLKVGTYGIQQYSKFFEGSQGKTRTQPYFDMEDCHWDLYQVAEYPGPNPGEEGYNKSYWFAVYE